MSTIGKVKTAHLSQPPARKPDAFEEETVLDSVSRFTEDTFRTLGGTAAVALKSSSILTSSALQGVGVEEEQADQYGSVASLLTFGTTLPLAFMGTGVVATIAVKGLGFGQTSRSESEGQFQKVGKAYVEDLNGAYAQGQFLADGVMRGMKKASGATGGVLKQVAGGVTEEIGSWWSRLTTLPPSQNDRVETDAPQFETKPTVSERRRDTSCQHSKPGILLQSPV